MLCAHLLETVSHPLSEYAVEVVAEDCVSMARYKSKSIEYLLLGIKKRLLPATRKKGRVGSEKYSFRTEYIECGAKDIDKTEGGREFYPAI